MVSYFDKDNLDSSYNEGQSEQVSLALVKVETLCGLGIPLINSLIDVRVNQNNVQELNLKEDAATLSALVKTSVSLVRHFSARIAVNNPEKALAVRMKLLSFVGPVVANHYKLFGQLPNEDALFDIMGKVEAIFSHIDLNSWSRNVDFQDWSHRYQRVDTVFSAAQLEASIPVINAVSHFSFGFESDELLTFIMDEIVKKVHGFIDRLTFENKALWDREILESVLVKAFTSLYAQCHLEEISRLNSLDAQAQQNYLEVNEGGYTLEPIWTAFDARLHMVQILSDHLNLKNKQQWADVA